MAKEAFAATLPVFGSDTPITEALDDPGIKDWNALISTDGTAVTFAHITGRRLEPSSLTGATEEVAIQLPTSQNRNQATQAFKAALGTVPGSGNPAGRLMALVIARDIGNFVVVGTRYRCSVGHEGYSEADYRAYSGMCPLHEGGVLQ